MAFKISCASFLRVFMLLLLLAAIVIACFTLPVEKFLLFSVVNILFESTTSLPLITSPLNISWAEGMLRDFLVWVEEDLGPWGPLVLAVAYIPLTILAVPASVLTLGGGYLFGLPLGFVADSVGATIGAGAAFLLGRTLGRSLVMSKLNDYPQFRAVEIAIQRSGFKIVFLLRLVPLLPFNMLNYLLSVTSVSLVPYLLASWLGMMPITLVLVYVGTTLKDLSDVTHGWSGFSKTRWAFIALSLVVSVVLMIIVTRVAKSALDNALAENEDAGSGPASPELPVAADPTADLRRPLIIKVGSPQENQE